MQRLACVVVAQFSCLSFTIWWRVVETDYGMFISKVNKGIVNEVKIDKNTSGSIQWKKKGRKKKINSSKQV